MDISEAFGLEFLDLSGVDEYEKNRVLASLHLSKPNRKFPWFIGEERSTVAGSIPTKQSNSTAPQPLLENHSYVPTIAGALSRRVPLPIINPKTGVAVPINSNIGAVSNPQASSSNTVVNTVNQPLSNQYFSPPVPQYYSPPVVTTISSVPVHIQPTTYGSYTVPNTNHTEVPVNTTIFPTYLPPTYPVKAPVYYGVPPAQPIFVSHQTTVDPGPYYQDSTPQYVQNVSPESTVVSNVGSAPISQSATAHTNQWAHKDNSVINALRQKAETAVNSPTPSQGIMTKKPVSPLSADTPPFTPKNLQNVSIVAQAESERMVKNPPPAIFHNMFKINATAKQAGVCGTGEMQGSQPEPERTERNPEVISPAVFQNMVKIDATSNQTGGWGAGEQQRTLSEPERTERNPAFIPPAIFHNMFKIDATAKQAGVCGTGEMQGSQPEPERTERNPEIIPPAVFQNIVKIDASPKQAGVWGAGGQQRTLPEPEKTVRHPEIIPPAVFQNMVKIDATSDQTGVWGAEEQQRTLPEPERTERNPEIIPPVIFQNNIKVDASPKQAGVWGVGGQQRTLSEPEKGVRNPEIIPPAVSQNMVKMDPTPKQGGVWGAGKSWASLFTPKEDAVNPRINGVTKPKFLEAVNNESNNNEVTCPIKNPKKSQFIDPDCYRMGEFLINYSVDGRAVSLQPRGLINQSNYCYINSILQALIACPPMYNLLSGLSENISSNAKRKPTPVIDGMCKFVKEFNHLPANMRVSNRRSEGGKKDQKKDQGVVINTDIPFEPSWVYRMLNGLRTDLIEGRQEDAEEFLGCLLNNLNDEMSELIKLIKSDDMEEQQPVQNHAPSDEDENWQVMGSKNKGSILRKTSFERTPITDVFGGSLKSRILRAGDHITENTQPFLTLQLNIQKVDTVREALEALTTKYELEGVTSSKTNEQVEAWQQVMLDELPVVLVLHLKCFAFKLEGLTKIVKALEFPIDLKIDGKLLSSKTTNAKEKQYKLFAVVYHDGIEATKGHYITDAFHVGYSCWLRYDDASVKQVQEEQVLNPQGNRVPYLLFYRRSDTIRSR